jgi:ABC-type branched-subunit amino acid transport system permease subunit
MAAAEHDDEFFEDEVRDTYRAAARLRVYAVWSAWVGVLLVVGVIGAVLTVGLFDILVQSYLPLPLSWYGQAIPIMREMAFGAALIAVLLFRPLGLLGDMRRDKLMRRVHGA